MPKVSNDPKDRVIKARVNGEMSAWIDRQCRKHHLNVTEYIRRAIKCEMSEEKNK